jgi:hypothetical protein
MLPIENQIFVVLPKVARVCMEQSLLWAFLQKKSQMCLGCKGLTVTNTLAYSVVASVTKKKFYSIDDKLFSR